MIYSRTCLSEPGGTPRPPGTIPDSTFLTAAQKRAERYAERLEAAGLCADAPYRTLGVLTTGLPGEVIEVALLDEHGRPYVRRCCPSGEVEPGAFNVHGLQRQDLLTQPPISDWAGEFCRALTAPASDGRVPVVVCWAGALVRHALSAGLGSTFSVPLLDLQALVDPQDDGRAPYRVSLSSMRWTVDLPEADRTRALSTALVTRTLVYNLLRRRSAQRAPVPRQANR